MSLIVGKWISPARLDWSYVMTVHSPINRFYTQRIKLANNPGSMESLLKHKTGLKVSFSLVWHTVEEPMFQWNFPLESSVYAVMCKQDFFLIVHSQAIDENVAMWAELLTLNLMATEANQCKQILCFNLASFGFLFVLVVVWWRHKITRLSADAYRDDFEP